MIARPLRTRDFMDDIQIIKQAINEDKLKKNRIAGIYWYAAQEGKLLFRDVKNVACISLYELLAVALTNASGGSGFFTNVITNGVPAKNVITLQTAANGTFAMTIAAGTDTTTPTTPSTQTQLISAISGGITNNIGNQGAAIPLVFVGTFPIGSLGSNPGTTRIGELALQFESNDPGILSRIAVADGANLGNGSGVPVVINNAAAATFTVVIYL